MAVVRITLTEKNGVLPKIPQYASEGAAGLDLVNMESESVILKPLERRLFPTGISIELPEDCEAQIRPRSGNALKKGITVLNSPGTIDSDYRGEIGVILVNLSNEEVEILQGERIAQMVISKYEKASFINTIKLKDTLRGIGGFGSTGLK